MKTFPLTIVLPAMLLLGLTAATFAQDNNFPKIRKSPVGQQVWKMGMKEFLRSFSDGAGTSFWIGQEFLTKQVRAAWDISDEQHKQIQLSLHNALRENPEISKLQAEINSFHRLGMNVDHVDEETMIYIQDTLQKTVSSLNNIAGNNMENALTSEQIRKMKESQLANMGSMWIFSLSMFEALDLTDDQKREMENIRKELEPEFEQALNNLVDDEFVLLNMVWDTLEKEGITEMQSNLDEIAMREKLLTENSEYKKIYEKIQSQSQSFSSKFKIKMFDVLTDSQWTRLQRLIDDPPEYAKIFGKEVRKMRGDEEKPSAWQPGPNSWRPGDPIPEGYRQQRQERGRFPRNVQSE